MASFVETTLKHIDDRLRDLRQELQQLEAARAALAGSRRGRRATPRSTTRRTTTAARRARGGTRRGGARTRRGGSTRASQALELVRGRPGITIPEIAKEMAIQPNYLYRVLAKLTEQGLVRRDGQGWHPAS